MNQRILSLGAVLSVMVSLWGQAATFDEDAAFLKNHTDAIVLTDRTGASGVAVSPALQGRVLTSAVRRVGGLSFGWINRELIASPVRSARFNAFGGEDRLWLGPEGGQYSVYFDPGTSFDLEHWRVPPALDTLPFTVTQQSSDQVNLSREFELTNYSHTVFKVRIERRVRVLDADEAWRRLNAHRLPGVEVVAYESANSLINAGKRPWAHQTGGLSIWILGVFEASPATTIVVPINEGSVTALGAPVTSDYFGIVPPDRLRATPSAVYLKADGHFRSKIGINPRRSRAILGSYDATHKVLTIVQFNQPDGVVDYVDSSWKIQADPYRGDVANAYNDGPAAPGAPQFGNFYELESSSPAAVLQPGARIQHVRRTYHFQSEDEAALETLAEAVLGVSLTQTKDAFSSQPDHPEFPPGVGRELILERCSRCHSPNLILATGHNRLGWERIITKMARLGASGSDEDFTDMADYLTQHFPRQGDPQ